MNINQSWKRQFEHFITVRQKHKTDENLIAQHAK